MPLAQVIRFDERQAIGRARRTPEMPATGLVLRFTRFPDDAAAANAPAHDEDRVAGRGRDPG